MGEVQNFLYFAREIKYISEKNFLEMIALTNEIMLLINGLLNSISKRRNIKK
ncbi:hypothetical protein KKC32_00450 [Patescibacteria group bacterium]|nr:hypothetical protein [Patescibacteria group bacterium]